jgi:hypothetical protein
MLKTTQSELRNSGRNQTNGDSIVKAGLDQDLEVSFPCLVTTVLRNADSLNMAAANALGTRSHSSSEAGRHSTRSTLSCRRFVAWISLPTVHNLYTVVSLYLEIARTDFNPRRLFISSGSPSALGPKLSCQSGIAISPFRSHC